MTLKLIITLKECPDADLDMQFDCNPDDQSTSLELEVANAIITLANLIDNEKFNEKIGEFFCETGRKVGSSLNPPPKDYIM